MGKYFYDIQIWKDFLRCENHKLSRKHIYIYLYIKLVFLKGKHLYHKGTTNSMKNQPTDLKKLLAANKYDKGLICRIYVILVINKKKAQLINEQKI